MRRPKDYQRPEEAYFEDDWLTVDDISDEQVERLIEKNRFAFRRAWFEYIEEFDS